MKNSQKNYTKKISNEYREQIDNNPISLYQKSSEKSNIINDTELSKITGLDRKTISNIRRGITKNSKYLKYLENYSCEKGYWEQVDNKPIPPYIRDHNPNKITDVQLSKITGVPKCTLIAIRRGINKNSKYLKYLANYSCEKGYWEQIDNKPIPPYIPDHNPNKITAAELSRRVGIPKETLRKIRTGQAPNTSKYLQKLKNYSYEKGYWEKISDEPDVLIDFNSDHKISVLDLYEKYSANKPDYISNKLRSILVRYFVPYIGGERPKSARANQTEIEAALKFLAQVPADNVPNISLVINQSLETEKITDSNAYSIRNTIKAFINDPIIKAAYKNIKSYGKREALEKDNRINDKTSEDIIIQRVPRKKPFRLMAKNKKGELIYSTDYINDRLQKEIQDIKKYYQAKDHSQASIHKIEEKILEFTGWLVRYKNVSLDCLCLESIIKYSPLNIDINDFMDINIEEIEQNKKKFNDYILKKAFIKEMAFSIATNNIQVIKEYCYFIGNKAATALITINVISNIAKYIYRNEVGIHSEEYNSFGDIPVIKKIHMLERELTEKSENESPAIPYEAKSESWETVIQVLENIRRSFDTKRIGFEGQLRENTAIAGDLQRFLILAFLVLLPPDRSRSIWDMQINKTLIKGVFDGNYFHEENDKNKDDCLWYRYFGRDDYKTGKIYGEHIIEIPNFVFPDNKKFYEYIDLWLNWGRDYNLKCNHDYFFRTKFKHLKPYKNFVHGIVTRLFCSYGYKPVPPHTLRDIYITWLNANENATEEIKASIAVLQHHSVGTQKRVYDKNSNYQKSQLGYEFHQKSLKELF